MNSSYFEKTLAKNTLYSAMIGWRSHQIFNKTYINCNKNPAALWIVQEYVYYYYT